MNCLGRLLQTMQILPIFEITVVLLGGIAMYTPWIHLRRKDSITGKELSKKYPQHRWMRWGYITLYLLWVTIVFFLFYEALQNSWIKSVSFIGGVFASIGLFMGLFAVITGVAILPMRIPWILYVVGDKAKKTGRFQVVWSIGVIMIVGVMEVLHR